MNIPLIGNKPPKKPKIHNRGYFEGMYKGSIKALPVELLALGAGASLNKVSTIPDSDIIIMRKAAQEGLKQTGLYDKGVRTYYFEETSLKSVIQSVVSFIKKPNKFEDIHNVDDAFSKILGIEYTAKDAKAMGALEEEKRIAAEKLMKKGRYAQRSSNLDNEGAALGKALGEAANSIQNKFDALTYKTGQSDAYLINANKIIAPSKTHQFGVFHEMGHALNNNGNSILKGVQKIAPRAFAAAGTILTIALLNKRKAGDKPSDKKLERIHDGIKNHAPLLTGLAMTPILIEEASASIRGEAVARSLVKQGKLTKELLNKMRLSNLMSFSTYVFTAAAMVVACKEAIKFKDKAQDRYEAKLEEKYQAKLEKYNKKAPKN